MNRKLSSFQRIVFAAAGKRWAAILACATLLIAAGGALLATADSAQIQTIPAFERFHNPSGEFANVNTAGDTDVTQNAFFEDIGSNGRRCVSCHQPSDAWTVTPPHIQDRFEETRGTDPIFRPNDGSGCSTQDVSTVQARRKAYSLLLNKGLIRIELNVPTGAEFTVLNSDNPYGCNSISALSFYRRPLPTTNLPFLSTVMFDGREFPVVGQAKPFTIAEINAALHQQAADATTGHAQGKRPTDAQLNQIVDFELKLFTAQIRDDHAGDLTEDGAQGGPLHLSKQDFFLGINDPLGGNPKNVPFTSVIFNLYDQWAHIRDRDFDEQTEARRAVARGQNLFNTLAIPIKGVAGLNDDLNIDTIPGFCGTCHSSPNVGDHSVPAPLNIGLTDASRRTPDLPLITVMKNNSNPPQIQQVSDLGRAMITGKWKDIGRFKGPILRGLSGRAPYFHNGSAATLLDVVNFYDDRFSLHLSQRDKDDLVAFLKTL
jgi:cytochrome c peroxidase